MTKSIQAILILFAVVLTAIPSLGQEESAGLPINSTAAAENVEKMIGLTNNKSDTYRQEINALIDYTLHILRGPFLDGSGYQYAEAIMDKSAEPETMLSEKVDAVWKANQQQTFSAEARTVYSLQIYAPKYRTGLFKNNGDTYIESYRVEFSINGKKRTITREHKDWVRRNTAIEIPLPGIAEWAHIDIVAGVEPADVNHTVVELRSMHPIIKDDPKNPFSYSIEQLKALQKNIAYAKNESILEKLNEALKGIQTVPIATSSGLSADQRIIQKLEYIAYLSEGNAEEQQEAKQELKDLIEALKQH